MTQDIKKLRLQAKELGINSFSKSAEELEALIAAKLETTEGDNPEGDAPEAEEEADVTESPETARKPAPRRILEDESSARARKRAEEIRKERKTRGIDMSGLNYGLGYDRQEQGYVYHWFNDSHGRLQAVAARGYERVPDVEPRIVGKRSGMKAYLHRIPKEIYDEDYANRQKRIDGLEEQIMNGINKDSDSVERNRIAGSTSIKRGNRVIKKVSFT